MQTELLRQLRCVYEDLHSHPELSREEHRTAGIATEWLRECGFQVTESIGGTGVAGALRSGDGPVVLLRADMDALPVTEATNLPYASTVEGVMHACGHDMHVTCLLGAAREMAATMEEWSGTLIVVFQPAEELLTGARSMIADGLFDRVPPPDVVMGQHLAPLPAGLIGLTPGPAFAASDSIRLTLFGEGGHGSRPETTVDPVVMAAATVMRLQGIVSREIAAHDTAVLTVGAINAGTKPNIIADRAELLLSIRSFAPAVRDTIITAIERVVNAESEASGAPCSPLVELLESAPAVDNDAAGTAFIRPVLERVVGPRRVVDPGPVTGSEDVGELAQAAGAPIVYWLLGGADPTLFAEATTVESMARIVAGLPSNHSPFFAPVPDPTIAVGVGTLCAAARAWLD